MLKSSIHLVFCKELSHPKKAQSYAFNFKNTYPAGLIYRYIPQLTCELSMSRANFSKGSTIVRTYSRGDYFAASQPLNC
jgi:hypothetical protein